MVDTPVSSLIIHLDSGGSAHQTQEVQLELALGVEVAQAQVSSVIEAMQGPPAWTLVDGRGRPVLASDDSTHQLQFYKTAALEVWVAPLKDIVTKVCSAQLLAGDYPILQAGAAIETPVCAFCASHAFDQSLLQSLPAMPLTPFSCNTATYASMGLVATIPATDAVASSYQPQSPAGLFLQRLYFDAAVQSQPRQLAGNRNQEQQLLARLGSGCQTVNVYEDFELQAFARSKINFEMVQQYASASRTGKWQNAGDDVAFVLGLLKWFKRDFFSWTNKPKCDRCGIAGPRMESIGMTGPNAAEERGWAGRVELYNCKECSVITRFPRYNNPRTLLETRNGRCGEWANCFTLVCRACGLDARWVLDWTDHVWTEVWIESLNRYVHADPCENRLDTPLMYESGWKKQLIYVVAFSAFGVSDATPRYTRKMPELMSRRLQCTENYFGSTVKLADQKQMQAFVQRNRGEGSISEITAEVAASRKAADTFELCGLLLASKQAKVQSEETMGRITGDEEWKRTRGELGENPVANEQHDNLLAEALERTFTDFKSSELPLLKKTSMSGRLAWLVPNLAVVTPHQPILDTFVSSASHNDVNELLCIRSCDAWVFATTPNGKTQLFNNESIRINSVPLCAGGRGHNVVSLDMRTGALVDSANFDSFEDPQSGAKLSKYLHEISTKPLTVATTVLGRGENLARGPSARSTVHRMLQSVIPDIPSIDQCFANDGEAWLLHSELLDSENPSSFTSVCSAKRGEGPLFQRFVQQNPVDPNVQHEFFRCDGVRGSGAVSCLPTDVVSEEDQAAGSEFAFEAARRFCLARNELLGFTHIPAVGILLFNELGFPPVPQNGCTSFVKTVCDPGILQPSGGSAIRDPVTALCFTPSRGAHHPDTRAFDDSNFVVGLVRSILSHNRTLADGALSWRALWASLRVTAVRYFGGSFAHGIQLRYRLGDAQFWGPQHRGDDLNCNSTTVELEESEVVTSVSIRHGAILDSVTCSTSTGRQIHIGGSGGSTAVQFELPANHKFVGFYGGYGGHLHHLGIITGESEGGTDNVPVLAAVLEERYCAMEGERTLNPRQLFVLCDRHALQGYFPDLHELISLLLAHNPTAMVANALRCAVKYITNLINAPAAQRAKYSSIRLSNKYFKSNVGCLYGGLLLFTRGILPRFMLSVDATQLFCELPTQDECLASALYLSSQSASLVQELAGLLDT